MHISKAVRITSVLVIAFFFTAPGVFAGVYFESTQIIKNLPGQPDSRHEIKNYITEHASRSETSDRIIITDFDAGIMYQLDPQTKTYHQINLAATGMPRMNAQESAAIKGVLKKMMGGVSVTPTGETGEVAGYPCRKYRVHIMMTQSEYWVSDQVPGYSELKAIGRKAAEMFNRNPMMKQMNFAAMITDLNGFPLKTVMSMMNGAMTTTVTRIEKKQIPGNLFTLPAGYRKK